jgi:hypothetical protein
MQRFRPQIMAAIVCGTLIAGFIAWVGMEMGAVEVVTGISGAVFGFLGGVSLKVLEQGG